MATDEGRRDMDISSLFQQLGIALGLGLLDPGMTTKVALLLMFAAGAYLVVGDRAVAIAVGGGTAVLLHFKGERRAY
jgi:uncharacterized membrane protein (DUF4010 family)